MKLREAHYTDIDLKGWGRAYFHFHQLAGYVLGYFFVAGLAQFVRRARA